VNARTLELLSASGVTARFLAGGRRLERLTLRRDGRALATLRLDAVRHRFPFMHIQGQADSERLLEEALAERGLHVERGVEVTGVRRDGARALVDVVRGGAPQTFAAARVLATDGAGSAVRQALGIAFDGETYAERWSLYDVELTLSLPPDEASILLLDDGGLFLVRLEGDVWRVLGNVPRPLERLPPARRSAGCTGSRTSGSRTASPSASPIRRSTWRATPRTCTPASGRAE
jgi:2-polyprenyl-6-methoxyphenol hydroxylase-like FAD-dependent oxidoreductase